jgi:hypothetical protein
MKGMNIMIVATKSKEVEMIRKIYPEGTRIEVVSLCDPYLKLPPGSRGTVSFVDDIGTIHVNWDSGSLLGLINGQDRYKKVTTPI